MQEEIKKMKEKNNSDQTSFCCSIDFGKLKEVKDILKALKKGVEEKHYTEEDAKKYLNMEGYDKYTPLLKAIINEDKPMIKCLLNEPWINPLAKKEIVLKQAIAHDVDVALIKMLLAHKRTKKVVNEITIHDLIEDNLCISKADKSIYIEPIIKAKIEQAKKDEEKEEKNAETFIFSTNNNGENVLHLCANKYNFTALEKFLAFLDSSTHQINNKNEEREHLIDILYPEYVTNDLSDFKESFYKKKAITRRKVFPTLFKFKNLAWKSLLQGFFSTKKYNLAREFVLLSKESIEKAKKAKQLKPMFSHLGWENAWLVSSFLEKIECEDKNQPSTIEAKAAKIQVGEKDLERAIRWYKAPRYNLSTDGYIRKIFEERGDKNNIHYGHVIGHCYIKPYLFGKF